MVNSCSCEVSCNDDDMFPWSEEDEPQKNIPVIWKSLRHNSLDFSESCTTFIRRVILNTSYPVDTLLIIRTLLKRIFVTFNNQSEKKRPYCNAVL